MGRMVLQKFDSSRDYYRVLGVSEHASREDLERAYRGEARKRHPDGGGSEEEMKALNEAHDILSDPETRKAYDAERRPKRAVYASPAAFDPEAASKAGTLGIPVADPDFVEAAVDPVVVLAKGAVESRTMSDRRDERPAEALANMVLSQHGSTVSAT